MLIHKSLAKTIIDKDLKEGESIRSTPPKKNIAEWVNGTLSESEIDYYRNSSKEDLKRAEDIRSTPPNNPAEWGSEVSEAEINHYRNLNKKDKYEL